jgi:hypothetical protein
MHMVAAHSPNAIENAAETPDANFRHFQVSSYQQSQPNSAADSRRANHDRKGKSGFGRRREKRGH